MKHRPSKPDVRAQLEAAAAGKGIARNPHDLDPAFVRKHQPAFRAWERFAGIQRRSSKGEPLAAPSDLLTPLP